MNSSYLSHIDEDKQNQAIRKAFYLDSLFPKINVQIFSLIYTQAYLIKDFEYNFVSFEYFYNVLAPSFHNLEVSGPLNLPPFVDVHLMKLTLDLHLPSTKVDAEEITFIIMHDLPVDMVFGKKLYDEYASEVETL